MDNIGYKFDEGLSRDEVRVGGSWRHSLGLSVWGISLLLVMRLYCWWGSTAEDVRASTLMKILRSWGSSSSGDSPLLGILLFWGFSSSGDSPLLGILGVASFHQLLSIFYSISFILCFHLKLLAYSG